MKRYRFILGTVAAFALFVSVTAAQAEQVRYDGHRVVKVQVESKEQLDLLLTMTDDVWSESYGIGPVDVRVSPEQFVTLEASGLDYAVVIPDLQARIEAFPPGIGGGDPFDHFMDHAEVMNYLDTLVALRPDLAELFVMGQTVENRDMVGIRITGPDGGDRPGVFYHGAEHAREWIGVAVTLYAADRLIRNYDSDPEIRDLVNRVEWFIMPIFNVDGYIYSWTSNRYWRKNRRNNGNGTWGVDLNRNWSVGWGGEGSSGSSNSEVYRGPSPFSEPETQAMRDFFIAHPNIRAHNDVHAYGQYLLWPWGYTGEFNPDESEFRAVGDEMVSLIQSVHGKIYSPGPIYSLLYPASGVSVDWVYGERGILSYTYELRGNDFVIPPSEIIPNAEEIFPSLMYLTNWVTAAVWIEYPEGQPTILEPGVETTMQVAVTAVNEEPDPDGATLYVRTEAGGDYTSYPIAHLGGDEFLATFPARDCGDDTEYYVTAMGMSGGIVYSPPGAPEAFFSAQVGTLEALFEDDFEADTGWTVQNVDLQDGPWERGVPAGGGGRGDPASDYDGSGKCFVTDNVAGNSDVDGGPTMLLSPVFDLSNANDPQLSYARWFTNDAPDIDRLDVHISDDNGGSWTLIESVGHTSGWVVRNYRVSDYVGLTSQVRVRFSATDNPNDSVTEAGVDAVAIFDLSCEGSPLIEIIHGNPNWDRDDPETWISFNDWAFSGYIDPKVESTDGVNLDLGLDTFNVVFNTAPFGDAVGGAVTLANVSVEQTGGAAPNVSSVSKSGNVLTIELDRIITLSEWTTLVFDVFNADGVRIVDNGNEGEGVDEAARLDVAFQPADVNNSGHGSPIDLNRWIVSWNAGQIHPPDVSKGAVTDYTDISRNNVMDPIDLARMIAALTGRLPFTQNWRNIAINNPRP